MLSKCANPTCSNTFRYLYEGKLYLIDGGSAAKRSGFSRRASEARQPEYAWLCSSCCRCMAILIDEDFQVTVVEKHYLLQDEYRGWPR